MKNTLAFISVIAMTACSSAQENGTKTKNEKAPKAVTESFAKEYPNVKGVDWEKEGGNSYEGDFEVNKVEYSVVFDDAGKFIEEEVEIEMAELPTAISDYVSTNYPGKKIKEAALIKFANGTINYEAEVQGNDLVFDQNGQFIR